MDLTLALVAAAAVLAAAAVAHYAFWTRRLHQPVADEGLVRARTRDGWSLALGTRSPRGAARHPPVLLVHGLSANRWFMDAGVERLSLAAYLAERGFRTFSLDLRGHGASRDRPADWRPWTFDDYAREDVPAALDAIRDATGEEQVLWVGHSLGAVLGLVTCQFHPSRVAGIVALAGPMGFHEEGLVARYLGWGPLVAGRYNRTLARMVAPLAGGIRTTAAELAINSGNVDRPVFQRLMANAIEDVPPRVFLQVADWVRSDACRSADGRHDYRAGLAACRQPALFVAGERDHLAPREVVKRSHDLWGGEKELVHFHLGGGHSADYGHSDLLIGRRAPEEVFPVVADWLLGHSRPAAGGAP
jgi:pimeloyl-ACP methyl ester carboxylesterase